MGKRRHQDDIEYLRQHKYENSNFDRRADVALRVKPGARILTANSPSIRNKPSRRPGLYISTAKRAIVEKGGDQAFGQHGQTQAGSSPSNSIRRNPQSSKVL